MKKCKTCNKNKPLSEFQKNGYRNGQQRWTTSCKSCLSTPKIICEVCKENETRDSKKKACDSCYNLRRKAINLLTASQERAKNKGIENDLTLEFIIDKLKQPCPQTGLPFRLGKTGSNYSDRDIQTPSVDKIDPSKGYTKDNVQIVCWGYNVAKQRFTDKELLEFWLNVMNFHVRAGTLPTDSLYKKTDGDTASPENAVDEISLQNN